MVDGVYMVSGSWNYMNGIAALLISRIIPAFFIKRGAWARCGRSSATIRG